MNTDILMAAQGQTKDLLSGLDKAQALVAEGEARFSRFLEDSELTRLNRAAGTWFRVSPDMLAVLQLAQRYHQLTDGLFDPSILPDLLRAGYDRSMDRIRAEEILPAVGDDTSSPRAPFSEMQIDMRERRVMLPQGMALDLGGIAKGWIAEQAGQTLAEYAEACLVDAGGDIFLSGAPYGSAHWPIELEDPREPGHNLMTLFVQPGGVATSTTTRRSWKQATSKAPVFRHHLIDPRSGEPSQSGWASVTVISDGAAKAEVLAKVLLIAGEADSLQFMSRYPTSAFIAVDLHGKLWGSENSKEFLYEPV